MAGSKLRHWLATRRGAPLTVYASAAAFGAYFCMYAFRKPFTVGEFAELSWWGIDYKILLILSQVAGYTLSKFIGIRVVAEMPPGRRVAALVTLIAMAELSLVGFGRTQYPYGFVFLFLNGLPLGMIWGLVFSYLEGRRDTEVLAACLSASFIVSSGVVKAVGKHAVDAWGVTEYWMPALTGLLFLAPFGLFVWMLSQIPPPSERDEANRTARQPMARADRARWLAELGAGIGLLVGVHMMLTAMRDYRDLFAVEVLAAVNAGGAKYLAASEFWVMLVILAPLGAVMLVKDHRRALSLLHLVLVAGIALAAAATLALRAGVIGGYVWYVLIGVGMYLAYVPFHSILFDRIVALRGKAGNAGFLIYLADSTGYLSSVALLLYKNFGAAQTQPLEFLERLTLYGGIASCVAVAISWAYFAGDRRPTASGSEQPAG